jgi:hypothetical protein
MFMRILKEAGFQESTVCFKEALIRRLELWKKAPPQFPIWALVPPNPNPLIHQLLQGINNLPLGRLYISGKDESIRPDLKLPPTHPQSKFQNYL